MKEICRIAGVTRKTLFYYDRIGLLEPSRRSGKQNFKEYDADAVMRLLEIRLYRQMGLSIPVIQKILDGDEAAQKQYMGQIFDAIRSDIRKRSQDAEIISALKDMSRAEFRQVISVCSGLEDLREILLERSRTHTQEGEE